MTASTQPWHTAIALVTAQREMDPGAFCVLVEGMDVSEMVGTLAQLAFWVAQLSNHIAERDGVDPDEAWVRVALKVTEAHP